MFPFKEYENAILTESEGRHGGLTVVVTDAEKDDESGNWAIKVELPPKSKISDIEDGTAIQSTDDGVVTFSGDIIVFDEDAGILTVDVGESVLQPLVPGKMKLQPPDYLKKLRQFSSAIREDEDANAPLAERFMNLRDSLLMPAVGTDRPCCESEFLRKPQNLAVANAFDRAFSFVWGPPGTGKSYTLGHVAVEAVARSGRLLVLSNTNSSVDVLTFAIDDAFNRIGRPLKDRELIRYARTLTNRDEYAKREHLTDYTREVEKYTRERRALLRKLKDAERRSHKKGNGEFGVVSDDKAVRAVRFMIETLEIRHRKEVSKMLSNAKIVCASVTCALYNDFQRQGFDTVLVDEASVIPLAVWPCLLHDSAAKRFVVAGDPMQLEPVSSRGGDLQSKEWFENNIYSYLGMTEYRSIEKFIRSGAVTMLTEQSRMRKGICKIVSEVFYNGLVTGDRANPSLVWPSSSGVPNGAVVLIDPSSSDEPFGYDRVPCGSGMHSNARSANTVQDLVRKIKCSAPRGKPLSVAILSPFRSQARIHSMRFPNGHSNGDVSVSASTIHCSQGEEADVVILDLVDPASWFLNNPDAAHLWCVACSRAKEQLFVVGDIEKVLSGKYSGRLFRDAEQVGLSEGRRAPRGVIRSSFRTGCYDSTYGRRGCYDSKYVRSGCYDSKYGRSGGYGRPNRHGYGTIGR